MSLNMESYTSGAPPVSKLVYTTLPDMLDDVASKQPEKAAHKFIYDSKERREVSFQMLMSKSLSLASSLLRRGFTPGSRVAVIGRPCPEYLYLEYALLRTKMLLMRIPDLFINPGTLQTILQKYNCTCLVIGPGTDDQMLNKIEELLPGIAKDPTATKQLPLPVNHVFLMEPSKCEECKIETINTLIDEIDQDSQNVTQLQKSINPDDIALVMPTSGSTGLPKMATCTHFAYINSCKSSMAMVLKLTDSATVFYNDRPFSWGGGMQFTSVMTGCTMVYSDATSVQPKYAIMEQEKVTSIFTLPTFLFDAMQLSSSGCNIPITLKYLVTGGERVNDMVLSYVCDTFSCATVAYGSTEMLAMCFCKLTEKMTKQKLQLFPFTEIKLTDDNGLVPRGQPGVLFARGPFVSKGYLDEQKLSHDGWFNSGDVAKMDADGFIEIVGRVKDVISKGALKVHPIVIEDMLMKHPDIEFAAVIGVPDPRLFQEICACVIAKPLCAMTEGQLAEYSKAKFTDKVTILPKYFMIMDKFPEGATGKVDRRALTKMAVAKFNLESI